MHRSETRTQTIVLQPTPFCNIQCKYCYLPQRDDIFAGFRTCAF